MHIASQASSGDTTRAATVCSISGARPTPMLSASAIDASVRVVFDCRLGVLDPIREFENSATKSLHGGIAKLDPAEGCLKKKLDWAGCTGELSSPKRATSIWSTVKLSSVEDGVSPE